MANVDPQLESAYYSLGVIALKQGQPQDAVVQLANAIQIKRTDADALNLLGTALLQAGEPAAGRHRHSPGDRARADRLVRSVRPAGDGLRRRWPTRAGAQYAAGMVALCQDRPDDAQAKLGPLTHRAPTPSTR